jgi:hypothetical protein
MFRLSSLMMILVMTAPMARDCCFEVTYVPPCHESRHTENVTCPDQQAVAESKVALGVTSSEWIDLVTIHYPKPDAFLLNGPAVDKVAPLPMPSSDLYLRTGALLI